VVGPAVGSFDVNGPSRIPERRVKAFPSGALALISGALGWVSLLTDPAFSGVLLPMRPVHVAFAAVFCLSSVAWGSMLSVMSK
jgi:hypothetical protein